MKLIYVIMAAAIALLAFNSCLSNLYVLISGSGNIYLKGDPIIKKTISGSGRIIKFK